MINETHLERVHLQDLAFTEINIRTNMKSIIKTRSVVSFTKMYTL